MGQGYAIGLYDYRGNRGGQVRTHSSQQVLHMCASMCRTRVWGTVQWSLQLSSTVQTSGLCNQTQEVLAPVIAAHLEVQLAHCNSQLRGVCVSCWHTCLCQF
jgi:hypothetical protein